jgi:hypothetical protein
VPLEINNRKEVCDMHDMDRMQLEWEAESNGDWGSEYAEQGYETYPELYDETYDEVYGEIYDEAEAEGLFAEADEMELAAELLEIYDEAELDQFIGNLIRRGAQVIRRVVPPNVGRALGGVLRGVARQALPFAGGALGNLIAPGVGGRVGSQLASRAGRIFGLELEGLSPEDQEFEAARHFVRLAGEAVRQAAAAPPNATPQAVVQRAMAAAAQQHAPGLVGGTRPRPAGRGSGRQRGQRGTWVRRGNTIILLSA